MRVCVTRFSSVSRVLPVVSRRINLFSRGSVVPFLFFVLSLSISLFF